MERKTVWRVLWDNGHACGALSGEYDSEGEAHSAGLDWQADMIAATPGATDEDYTFDVEEGEPDEGEPDEDALVDEDGDCRACGHPANGASGHGTCYSRAHGKR